MNISDYEIVYFADIDRWCIVNFYAGDVLVKRLRLCSTLGESFDRLAKAVYDFGSFEKMVMAAQRNIK